MKCNKIAYIKEEKAEEILRHIRKCKNNKTKPARYYLCNNCNNFHLTSQNVTIKTEINLIYHEQFKKLINGR